VAQIVRFQQRRCALRRAMASLLCSTTDVPVAGIPLLHLGGLAQHRACRWYRVITAIGGRLLLIKPHDVHLLPVAATSSTAVWGIGSGLACRSADSHKGLFASSIRTDWRVEMLRVIKGTRCGGAPPTDRSIRRAASPEPWQRSSLRSSSSAESSSSSSLDWWSSLPARPSCLAAFDSRLDGTPVTDLGS
jgi:hypothetical protein